VERAAFLDAIRTRLSGDPVADAAIPDDWAVTIDVPRARFEEELSAIGGSVYLAGRDDVASVMGAILQGRDRPRVLLTREEGIPDGVAAAIEAAGSEVLWWPDAGRAGAARADIGITSARWAVAETGTVVVASDPPSGRSPSLLPPTFVCFVPVGRVLDTIAELFRCLASDPVEASNVVLVTGPSKSADIGMELTRGVHGPGEVHVVLVDAERRRP
jgi:L-lactate dehydrogenase complex protein LldG